MALTNRVVYGPESRDDAAFRKNVWKDAVGCHRCSTSLRKSSEKDLATTENFALPSEMRRGVQLVERWD